MVLDDLSPMSFIKTGVFMKREVVGAESEKGT